MRNTHIILVYLICNVIAQAQNKCLSPLDFGLTEAKNGIERYEALLACHQQAVKQGVGVCYRGIDSLYLEIPPQAKGIPLSDYTDFAGLTLYVANTTGRASLFVMENPAINIKMTKKRFTRMKFSRVKELRRRVTLLIVEDKTPWVDNRIGYSYGATRRDIILIEDGKAMNKPVMPYSNDVSDPSFKYCKVTSSPKIIKNLAFNRTKTSTQITCFVNVDGQNNIIIKNVTISTPDESDLYGDEAIILRNCTNVLLEDVTINGTYSRKDKYGYGIGMNNVWNSQFIRLKANGKWGVFGNNNVNNAIIEDCDINRFDIHCYGRDVHARKTTFRNLYNQFSSTYGVVEFEDCVFYRCTPYLNSGSYNAFVPVDVFFERCLFHITKDKNSILRFSGLTEEINSRAELSLKSLPNVTIDNCRVEAEDDVDIWYVIHPGGVRYNEALDHISHVRVSIKANEKIRKSMVVIPPYVRTKNKLDLLIE